MLQKKTLRQKYFFIRKKKYFEINKRFSLPLINFIKSKFKRKRIKIALYYPSNFEINVIKILENNYFNDKKILLPVIKKDNRMEFFSWKKNESLFVNKFGFLEPIISNPQIPDIILVPVLAFDGNKYRLGYGKGFYDRYLNRYIKKFKNIITVGIAFSFQKYNKLPVDKNDVRLNFVLTEKGFY